MMKGPFKIPPGGFSGATKRVADCLLGYRSGTLLQRLSLSLTIIVFGVKLIYIESGSIHEVTSLILWLENHNNFQNIPLSLTHWLFLLESF